MNGRPAGFPKTVHSYYLDTPTPEKYPCARFGCDERAVVVEVVQTPEMASPGFYGSCEEHRREEL